MYESVKGRQDPTERLSGVRRGGEVMRTMQEQVGRRTLQKVVGK